MPFSAFRSLAVAAWNGPLPLAVTRIQTVLSVLSVPSAISALRSVAVAVCCYPDSGRSQRSLCALCGLSVKICRRCRGRKAAWVPRAFSPFLIAPGPVLGDLDC